MFALLSAMPQWRGAEQLTGLQERHPAVVATVRELRSRPASVGCIAVHPSGTAAVVATTEPFGAAEFGLLPLACDPSGDSAPDVSVSAASWLQLPDRAPCTSLAWGDSTVYVGSSRGRVVCAQATPESCGAHSGGWPVQATLKVQQAEDTLAKRMPTSYGTAPTTCVACVQLSSSRRELLGVSEHRLAIWDLGRGDALPMRVDSEPDGARRMAAEWLEEGIIAAANFGAGVSVIDLRARATTRTSLGPARDARGGGCILGLAASPVVPNWLLAAGDDGTVSLFDLRWTAAPLLSVATLQGRVNCVAWSALHPDLYCSGGADGTVGVWGARAAPMHGVAKVPLRAPVSGLVALNQQRAPTWLCISAAAEVATCGLTLDGAAALAPATLMTPRLVGGGESGRDGAPAELLRREREVEMLLHARRVAGARTAGFDCARSREVLRDHGAALRLLDRVTTPARVAPLSVGQLEGVRDSQARRLFAAELESLCERVPETLVSNALCAAGEDDAVSAALSMMVLSVSLGQAIETRDAPSLRVLLDRALTEIAFGRLTADESLHLDDAFRTLAAADFCAAADVLTDYAGRARPPQRQAMAVLRRLVLVALGQPVWEGAVITSPQLQRRARKLQDAFFRDHEALCAMLPLQLRLLRLWHRVQAAGSGGGGGGAPATGPAAAPSSGEEGRSAVTTTTALPPWQLHDEAAAALLRDVVGFQQRALDRKERGVFGWTSTPCICAYLWLLLTKPSLEAFLWTAAELMERFSGFPVADTIGGMARCAVDDLTTVAKRLQAQLGQHRPPTPQRTPVLLRSAHTWFLVVARATVQCENIFVKSALDEPPRLVAGAVDTVGDALNGALDAWADLLDELGAHRAALLACRSTVAEFSEAVESLADIAQDGDDDALLGGILDLCDDFLDLCDAKR